MSFSTPPIAVTVMFSGFSFGNIFWANLKLFILSARETDPLEVGTNMYFWGSMV